MSEEKKPTDEEIAKAILKQIEYNTGIPYINEWQQVKTIKFTEILDLIHRLQKENKGIKKLISKTQLDLMFEQAKTIEQQKVEIKRLESETEEQYKRIMELEQDLVHADEKVFYRECDVALDETKLKNKGALELAQEVESYFAYYQGESFTTEQILDIIKQTLIEDFNFKEQTNEN